MSYQEAANGAAASPPPPLVTLHSDSHRQSILSKLATLRERELLCDTTLVVEDVHYKAHKALLAASSDFFALMFTAEDPSGQSTYRLEGMASAMFAAVLDFIYSARVCVEEGAAEQLLATARLMEVNDLVDALTQTAAEEEEEEEEDSPNDSPSRKRGRPRKSAWEEQQVRSEDFSQSGGRKSKRKIRPPVKYKSYRVDSEPADGEEIGKRGRKRKYPETEARCEDCDKVFKNHLFLKIHQRTHTGEKPFVCLVCGKSFTQKHTLLVHQRMHTGEKPFVCSVCSKALSTKHALQEHMNLHEGNKSYSCDTCGKSFTQKRQLKSHYRVHTDKSFPECAQCQHKFMDTAQLKKHLRTHTGEKPFTCEICGKCFTAKSTLQTHIRIHRGEKPYDCSICSKSFSDASARRRHVASHSGQKPFTCSFCSLSFTRLDNLKTHAKSHIKEGAAVTTATAENAAPPPSPSEIRNILQQYHQEPEIQLVVDVDDFRSPDARLVTPGGVGGGVGVVGGGVGVGGVVGDPQLEQMHVITLSKEAMEQLQAQHGPPQPVQGGPRAGDAPHHAPQGVHVSHASQQISSNHIHGQTFQIQAGAVSYLYTTGS